MRGRTNWGLVTVAAILAVGWTCRELAWAFEAGQEVMSGTVAIGQLKMAEFKDGETVVGQNGVYLAGDTPGSTKFMTGRFVLNAGKSPHAPHVHAEEEVMVIESGHGEIVCDGKTTPIGPGSVMYSAPNVRHGITNTGDEPIVFYYVKWEARK